MQASSSSGVISKVYVGENLDMIPISVGSDINSGFCDYYYQTYSNDVIIARSAYDSEVNAGLAYIDATRSQSYKDGIYGTRLAFRGDIIVEDDVQAFRSIPITNLSSSPITP